MEEKLERGQVVMVDTSSGLVERTVVEDLGESLLLCRSEEFLAAKSEGRNPTAGGISRSAIRRVIG